MKDASVLNDKPGAGQGSEKVDAGEILEDDFGVVLVDENTVPPSRCRSVS